MGNKNGKQSSDNQLKKRRAQSITWSFRYSTMRRKNATLIVNNEEGNTMATVQQESIKRLKISEWLKSVGLSEYEKNFKKFSGIEKLFKLKETDLKSLGIKNIEHRGRILSELVVLHDKFKKQDKNETGKLTFPRTKRNQQDLRHSIAGSGPTNQEKTKETFSSAKRQKSDASINIKRNSTITINDVDDDDDDGDAVKIKKDKKDIPSSNPIYEVLSTTNTKQSKSCGDLLDMDSKTTTPTSENPNPDVLVLKKALEWELSLDSRDLRSHAWYHGAIPRQRSEEIVQKDGDFLVRDCASQPGNYVLTCRSKSSVLHFVIHKIFIQPETVYERVQYQFEEDAYDTVPDLITFYVGSGKPISAASGARIQFPVNRNYPLSFYGNKIVGNQLHSQILAGIRGISPVNSPSIANLRFNPYNQQGSYNNAITAHRSPMSSPPRTKRDTPPRLPSKKQRSQSLTPVQGVHSQSGSNDKYCSADGTVQERQQTAHSNNEMQRLTHQNERSSSVDGSTRTNGTLKNNHQQKISNEKSSSGDGIIKQGNGGGGIGGSCGGTVTQRAHSHSLPRPMTSSRLKMSNSRTSSLNRETSDSTLAPCLEQNKKSDDDEKAPSPPPKPTRPIGGCGNNSSTSSNSSGQREKREQIKELPLEQQNPLNRVASYHASGSDSGNGSGDSAQSSATGDLHIETHVQQRGVVIKNPRYMTNSISSMTLKCFNEFDIAAAELELANMEIPIFEQISKFDLENFSTVLLPSVENNPLDSDALNTFRIMLYETGPRIIAQHLTRIDVLLILGELDDTKSFPNSCDDHEPSRQDNIFKLSGIELLTLPHGETFRNDLIERTQCIKLLVAITIITCQNDFERAETLDKWIQVAIETKTALGNLYGFCAIMLGLCMPQIQKLETAWHTLRQKFTDSAFTFEAKLRPTLKSMNDCSNPQAPNTTVPHLLPYILLRDRNLDDILLATTQCGNPQTNNAQIITPNVTAAQQNSALIGSCITNWESNADDFGISILFAHLDATRTFTKNLPLYRRNAQIVLENAKNRLDELLTDAFRTEFHLKFLWGSKGAIMSAEERHSKLEHVLGIMANKFCNTEQIGCAG